MNGASQPFVRSDLQPLLFPFRYEGTRGFYKGLLPSLLRVTPATAITFVVYENVFHALKSLSSKEKAPAADAKEKSEAG